jgi:predicted aspartyl protease
MIPRLPLFLWFVLVCGMAASKAQVPGFFIKDDSRKVVMPFTQVNHLVIMPVSINGGPELNFLFDTGVKSNILFSKTIGDTLGLSYSRKLNLIGADGQTVLTASVSTSNHIDLGEVEGVLQAILVLEEDFLELEKVLGIPIYGVIGYEFFKHNPVKIDYDFSKLTFYRAEALRWRPFGYRIMQIEIDDSKPYVISKIDQTTGPNLTAKLLIDTGANHSLLLNREASSNIVLPEKSLKSDLGRSLGGDLFGFIGRVDRLGLGGITFREVLTSYPDPTEFSNIILGTGRLGSLGSELLSRMKLILDYPRGRLLYKKSSSFSQPFSYDMSGITVRLLDVEEGRVYVSQIKDGSPADLAGIRQYDEIFSINNVPVFFWKLSDINDLFRSEAGRRIKLGLFRDSENGLEELNVSIVLREQL